jgi:hypothetical protein
MEAWQLDRTAAVPPHDAVAFVYLITNIGTGRKYIGKKNLFAKKTSYKMHTQKNGKKVKRKVVNYVPSDWENYWGSCTPLLTDIYNAGSFMFKREILMWCNTRAIASYYEAKQQFDNNVLLDDNYYNRIIQVRVNATHLKDK